MLLADYFRFPRDEAWDASISCGVRHAIVRLPETPDFDVTDEAHWHTVMDGFASLGLTPVGIEPMPNALHDHIKAGDEKRDECIDKVIRMLAVMDRYDVRLICFNFMAHIGWLRTRADYPERGGAFVTAFDLADFDEKAVNPDGKRITAKELWDNYTYFVKAVVPEAEKHGICLGLHPDDPPLEHLGGVERIFINKENIRKAVYDICPSEALGVTYCQANYHIMGEDVAATAREWAKKIFFVHFRNTTGTPTAFRETFHDNGDLDMASLLKTYKDSGIDVPIRVDHVPTMPGESPGTPGYGARGRYFAIGYLKGLLEAIG